MKAQRAPDPLASFRNRANALTGTAAQEAFAAALERYEGVVWMPGADNSPRYKKDIYGFDLACLTGSDLLLVQVKATAKEPWPPTQLWLTKFLGLPKPPGVRFLLAWLTPEEPARWRVWRLLPDGTRLDVPWPPERTEREMR